VDHRSPDVEDLLEALRVEEPVARRMERVLAVQVGVGLAHPVQGFGHLPALLHEEVEDGSV